MTGGCDFAAWRRRFPSAGNLAYLNSGSYGLLADSVKASFERYLDDRLARGADWGLWAGKQEAVRERVARLLNAEADEIAVTASASASMNALASALDFTGGRDKIVISDFEFPTSGQIWHAQEQRGARIEHVPELEDGHIPLERFERAIDERTKLVVITHVCYRNGAKLPVAEIARIAHAKGALIMLDCFQSVGADLVDVRGFDVDFCVGGMLKYLLGTAGIGFLYVRRPLIEALTPTNTGWFAQDDIDAMDIFANRPSRTASRFQAGTPPVPNCYAAEAGLDIILEIGVEAIAERVRQLTRLYLARIAAEGWAIATPLADDRRGPMVAIRSTDQNALVQALGERGVVVSCRDGNVRAGFHFYNDESDVEALVAGLKANRSLLKAAARQ